jgi:hypothetical protein
MIIDDMEPFQFPAEAKGSEHTKAYIVGDRDQDQQEGKGVPYRVGKDIQYWGTFSNIEIAVEIEIPIKRCQLSSQDTRQCNGKGITSFSRQPMEQFHGSESLHLEQGDKTHQNVRKGIS